MSWRSFPWRRARFILYAIACAVIVVVMPEAIPLSYRIAFLPFAAFIAFVCNKMEHGGCSKESIRRETPWGTRGLVVLSVFALLYILATRLFFFVAYGEAPLGYDTGIYLQLINAVDQLRNIDPSVISIGHFPYASWLPYLLIGVPPLATLHLTYILYQLLTAGALYFLVRQIARERTSAAAAALFLFAVSITQFAAYWWFFYKQSMAIPFLLFAVACYLRRSWLAIPAAVIGAAIHLQSAAPFAVGLVVSFTILPFMYRGRRNHRHAFVSIVAGVVVMLGAFFILKGPRELAFYTEHLFALRGFASNARPWEILQNKGLFISLSVMTTQALFYLPFGVWGVISTIQSIIRDRTGDRRRILLVILIVALFIFSIFPFVYQHRAVILFDLLLITFAAVPFSSFMIWCSRDRIGKCALATLIIGGVTATSLFIGRSQPQVYPDELAEIRGLRTVLIREPNAYAMVTSSVYMPWVQGFTNYSIIAPGSPPIDQWTLPMWQEFWSGADDERRHELLAMYGNHPIYIFIGRQPLPPKLRAFIGEEQGFKRVSAYIWRYDGSLRCARMMCQ